MWRMLPILTAGMAVIVCGIVHGFWTDRWQKPVETTEAAARLEQIPTEIGDWVADRLAGYKRPRRIAVVDEVRRTTVSKVDLEWAREVLVRSS